MSKADTWVSRFKPVYLVFVFIAIYTVYFAYFILNHYAFQTHLVVIMAVALETFAATSMLILTVGIYLFRRRTKISLLYLIVILAIAVSIVTLYAGASFAPPLPEGYY